MATRRKYIREVVQPEKVDENVIKVSQRTMASTFVRRAIWLLNDQEDRKAYESVILQAIDSAIPKALIISEVVRRRVPGLYQVDTIGQSQIDEVYQPTEEGLVEVKLTKKLATFEIKLTTNPSEQDKNSVGFHELLPESEIEKERPRGEGRPRRRGGYNGGRSDRSGSRRDDRNRRDDRDRDDRRRSGDRRRGGDRYRDRDEDRRRDDRDRDDRRSGDRRRGGDRDGDREGDRRRYDRGEGDRRRDDRDGERRDDRQRGGERREGGNRRGYRERGEGQQRKDEQ